MPRCTQRGIGRVGWHGIVPSKALPMANDIVDNVMLRLINVSQVLGAPLLWLYLPWLHLLCLALHLPSRCTWQVFTRLPPDELAASLDSTVLRVGREIAAEIGTDPKGKAKAWAPLIDAAVRDARFNETLLAHSRPLFAAVVRAPYYGATYRDAAYYCYGRGGVPPAIATRGCSPMCCWLQPRPGPSVCAGLVGELIVYDELLSDAHAAEVLEYLNARWRPTPARTPVE